MGEPSLGTPSPTRPSEGRLDSWKEIAAYLKRDVTTVQRWEKREGMPVHRHLHGRIGSVYAFGSELDVWVQSRKPPVEEEQPLATIETPPATVSAQVSAGSPKTRRRLAVAMAFLLALIAGAYVVSYRQASSTATRPKITSLAVLPLKNLSGDPTQEYLADGMTEALIGRLSGIHDLRVISRTSAMHFKDTQLAVPEIARTLGVDAMVEGSVIRDGGRVRVHAQLIRAATDEHFWSETYDRELGDALGLESDVAQTIAGRVEVTVTGAERARLVAARQVSPDVYDAGAHLSFSSWLLSQGRTEEALAWSRRARELDPIGITGNSVGWILFHSRHYDEAIRELRSDLAVRYNDAATYWSCWFLGF